MPFQYSQYHPALTDTIAARIANQGAIEARRAQQSGNAYAGMVQNIGSAVAQIPAQIQQQKAQQQETTLRGQSIDANNLHLGEQKRAIEGRDAFAKIIKDTPQVDEDGVSLYDIPAVAKQLAALGQDPAIAVEHLGKLNDAFRSEKAAKLALIKTGAAGVAAAGNDPVLAAHFLDQLEKNGSYPAAQVQQFRQLIEQGGQPAVERLTSYLMGPQKPVEVPAGGTLVDPVSHKPVYSAPEKPVSVAPGATLVNPQTGAKVFESPKPKAYQSKSVMVDGKPVEATFDPTTGALSVNGQDVTTKATPIPPASMRINLGSENDVKDVVAGMKAGTLPPQLPGRASKEYVAIMAEARRQGFDIASAATDWAATQKHIATMNGAQQLRLNQAINSLPDMLDSVDALAAKWKGGNFPILNKANLALAKGGAFGKDVASVANQLDAQIADVTADLGNVYMGGNSPTDHALGLAGKSLSAEWDEKVLHDMVALAKKNVVIRQNSIRNTGVSGASENNMYAPPQNAPAGGQNARAGGMIEAIDPQGNVHHAPAGTPLPAGWKLK